MYFLINLFSFLVCLCHLLFSGCLILFLIILSCFFAFRFIISNCLWPMLHLFLKALLVRCADVVNTDKLWAVKAALDTVCGQCCTDTAELLVQSLSTSCSYRLYSYVFLHILMSCLRYGDTWPSLALRNIGKNANLWKFFFCHENKAIAYATLIMSIPW